MTEILLSLLIVIALAATALLVVVWRQTASISGPSALIESLSPELQRIERLVRDELSAARKQTDDAARGAREEMANAMEAYRKAMVDTLDRIAAAQKDRLELFEKRLVEHTTTSSEKLGDIRTAMDGRLQTSHEAATKQLEQLRSDADASSKLTRENFLQALTTFGDNLLNRVGDAFGEQNGKLDSFSRRLSELIEASEKRGETLRTTVEQRLDKLRTENGAKLDEMRQVVDEKLQGTLEKRLGESFRHVSDRLEQVHKGLGEMQSLAAGVGDLKRVMTNVKSRGTWGEFQLSALLEQILSPTMYDANVATNPASGERVEFAIKLPGDPAVEGSSVYLPIDAKFPVEDYQRLVDCQDLADVEGVAAAGRQLEASIKSCAKDISSKYISPPHTTDFAIMFLPSEGLYAEVARRPALVEHCQRHCRVVVAGPTTLGALLNSLHMGFRTLAIQQRSSEVWNVLGAVKTEFDRFGGVIQKVKKKLQEASNTVDSADVRARAMNRQLRNVEALPAAEATRLLGLEDEAPALLAESLKPEQNGHEP